MDIGSLYDVLQIFVRDRFGGSSLMARGSEYSDQLMAILKRLQEAQAFYQLWRRCRLEVRMQPECKSKYASKKTVTYVQSYVWLIENSSNLTIVWLLIHLLQSKLDTVATILFIVLPLWATRYKYVYHRYTHRHIKLVTCSFPIRVPKQYTEKYNYDT